MLLAKRMAWLLLDTYAACADAADMEQQLMAGLAVLTGGFAFVLHDRSRHRVVAARDRAGQQPLLWGMTADAALVFSSSTASAIDQAVNPAAFPPGCLFVSDCDARAYAVFVRGATPGSLKQFARGAGQGPMHRNSRCARSTNALVRMPAMHTDAAPVALQLVWWPLPHRQRHRPQPHQFHAPHAVVQRPDAQRPSAVNVQKKLYAEESKGKLRVLRRSIDVSTGVERGRLGSACALRLPPCVLAVQ